MIHKICDECGTMESVDFMVTIDDDIYCTECLARKEKENTWLDVHVKRYLEKLERNNNETK